MSEDQDLIKRQRSQIENLQCRCDLLLATLNELAVASCSCQTKTPDPEYHDERCRYRIIETALATEADLATAASAAG